MPTADILPHFAHELKCPKHALLQQEVLNALFDPRPMKVHEIEFSEEREQLMIFRSRHSNGCAAKNGVAPKHELSCFEQKRVGIRVRFSRVIEIGPVLYADTGFNQTFDYDLR